MRSRALLGLAVLATLTAGVLVAVPRWNRPRMVLPDGTELRLLKVSRGTNHVLAADNSWQAKLRRRFPSIARELLPSVVYHQRLTTANDSLVIWVEKVHPQLGQRGWHDADQFEAVFPGQGEIRGHAFLYSSIAAVEFRSFERKRSIVPLQLREGTNVIAFTVKNPFPSEPVSWNARALPLPQTNRTTHVLVRLSVAANQTQSNNRRFYPRAIAPEGQHVGWMQWDCEGFDEVGNWARVDWVREPRGAVDLPLPGENDRAWKIVAKGTEYLSAGFLPQPMTNAIYSCSLNPRARAVGVRFVAYVEPGSYVIAGHTIRLVAGPPAIASPALDRGTPGDTYTFRFRTPEPALVCAFETGDYPKIRTRLRERDRDNRGRNLPHRSLLFATGSDATVICAGYFDGNPLDWLSVATNKVEVEIIATHPDVEFFVRPPGM